MAEQAMSCPSCGKKIPLTRDVMRSAQSHRGSEGRTFTTWLSTHGAPAPARFVRSKRAAERQWAKPVKQIESVTYNISGMYGDLQGLVPPLPSISSLELPAGDQELIVS